MARLSIFEKKIIQIFETDSKPLSAVEISTLFLSSKNKPHKATIYRNIKNLLDKNLIVEAGLNKGSQSYQLNTLHSHYFFCKKCDKKYSIPNNLADQIEKILLLTQQKMDQEFSLEQSSHTLQFSTFCNSCINF
jgi:Fe2+ or Zn2+ uptake regulation protein